MKKSVKILLIVLCIIFVGVFAFSGYKLYSIMHEYNEADKMYSGLNNQFVSSSSRATPSPDDPLANEETSPISVDFDALLAQSQDVVGWIYGPDTVINYPIVQAEDNFYYLYRFIDGTYNGSGTIFMDCLCNPDFSGRNSVIYGHNMNDGSMFASIRNYTQQEYYDEHPTLYLNTPTQNYRIEVFSGYVTDADSDTYTIGFMDDAAFTDYIARMRSQSTFESSVEVTAEDNIITLSTCSYEYYDARYVLQGKLVPIN